MTARSLQLSVPARVFGDDLRQAVERSRRAGFAGVQIDAVTRALDLTALSASGYRDLRGVLARHAQPAVALRAEIGVEGLGPRADVDRVLDRVDGVLRAAAALAVPVVCLDLGRLPPATIVARPKKTVTPGMAGLLILPDPPAADDPPPPTPKADPAVIAHWRRATGTLGETADRYGVMLAMAATLSPLAALEQTLRPAGCPWFGVDFDPSALLRDDWSADDFFDALGPLVRHVRARDAVAGDAGRTKPAVLGRGDVPWRTTLELLDAAGYHAAVTVDSTDLSDPAAAAVAGMKQLNAVLASG